MDTPSDAPSTLPAHPRDPADLRKLESARNMALGGLIANADRCAAPAEGYPPHGENCICPRCGLCRALAAYKDADDAVFEWCRS